KNLKIFLLGTLVIILGIAIFFIGKKFGEKKETIQVKDNQTADLEKQLQQLKNQLQKETDPTKKQELEQKKKNLEQQIQNLGGSNNPSPPNPSPKTSRQ